MSTEQITTVVVFGASGDLAKKKTFPALFMLYHLKLIQANTKIIGYARSAISREDFHARLCQYIKPKTDLLKESLAKFLDICSYQAGQYDDPDAFELLNKTMHVAETGYKAANRLFYMALPPSVFVTVATRISNHLCSVSGYFRVIVEKPFGHDLESSRVLSKDLLNLFTEDHIYRIDHYLGKEMVKNVLVIRFANVLFSAMWNRIRIANVQITFKEPFGTEGRGGYFDGIGMVRDVMQNHLLQVLTIVAMETPVSLKSDDIRDEKVKVLKSIAPVELENCVLGQYGKSLDGSKPAYKDDAGVPSDSVTPTFATAVLYVNNERWDGVPFILRCGKALNEKKAEIRIQLKDMPGTIFGRDHNARNELVFRLQPDEAVYCKVVTKKPGLTSDTIASELDLSYKTRFDKLTIPDAYESLILDALKGDRANFVRSDELDEAWRIFTPLLHRIEDEHIEPEMYDYGSRGPASSDTLIRSVGYVRQDHLEYSWPSSL